MTANDQIRINKVLKEFNIGMGTLVEFLGKKGITIEANPNAKITGSAYALVEKEFRKEQIVKEESKKVAMKVKETRKEQVVKEEPKSLFIKTTVEEVKGPKILGKINLDKPAAPAQPQQSTPAAPKEPQAEAAPKEKSVQQEVKPAQQASAPAVKPEVQENRAQTAQNNAQQAKTVVTPQPTQQATKKDDTPQPVVIEHIETKVEKLTGPKISGTIDLSQFEKKKEKNKGKRERIHKQKERVDVTKEAGKNPNKQQGGQNNNGGNHSNSNKQNPNKPQGGKGGNQQQGGGKHNKKDKFKPVRVEIDEDEVQKQIKETYQRMVEGKGKSKGAKYRKEKRELNTQKMMEEEALEQQNSNILKVTEFVTVNDLSIMINVPVTKVIEACMNLGLMVSINQRLDAEALVLVAEEFGYKIDFVTAEIQETINEENDVDNPENMEERPPIITVMGHVDHGKTSLLDYIRKANVIAGEAGGITQHIGAYNVMLPSGRRITFLDTPGHEAFTAMRARGAKITDLAIIIIAADDAIMPQTVEAINHAQAAGVPMVFAINKIDKPSAYPEKIREQLSQMNILVEDWGGKYQCQEISAKKGIGVEDLLEKVLLETDMLELKANPNKKAIGTVIESSLDKGRGYLATILVQGGTLHVGDIILSGCYTGKVKAMFNERGQKVTEAGPSTPVSILGLNGAPTAGETFNVFDDEKEAKDIANKREQLLRIQGLRTQKHITLEEIGRRIAIGNFQELNVIIKGDVDGSIEALSDSLIKLSTEEIHVNVIHKAVGAISESDVLLAAASNAIIVGFQVRPSASARKLADKEEIEIRLYSVIYDAINEVKSGIEGMLAPEEKEEVTATAEVRETFKISKVGTIAGCMVKEGKLTRNAKVRVIRDGIVIYTGVLGSLKRFKDDVKEVQSGYDCGLNIEGYNDIKVGDVIEAYQIVEIKRTL
ncbi:MAG: translation initiation factor IF-2 [Bacteroidales bacterium]|nr:translation initiation factor IF-2 [Bacteroidales bacterium]